MVVMAEGYERERAEKGFPGRRSRASAKAGLGVNRIYFTPSCRSDRTARLAVAPQRNVGAGLARRRTAEKSRKENKKIERWWY
jgi:hypothetical protein